MDMLADLGFASDLMAEGRVAPNMQYRSKAGVIAQFDFACIADMTRHPFQLQAEQFKLNRIIHARLKDDPLFEIAFHKKVMGVTQNDESVCVRFEDGTERRGCWLIGADGARSGVRRGLGIEFEGFTWPERFLVVSTPYEFTKDFPDLSPVSYVADPVRWHFLLRVPGFWRAMFPVDRTNDGLQHPGTMPRPRYARSSPASASSRSDTLRSTACTSAWRVPFVRIVCCSPVMQPISTIRWAGWV